MGKKQLQFDFEKKWHKKGETKKKVLRIVAATVKRINKETDPDKKYKLKIIKHEFSKLADDLS